MILRNKLMVSQLPWVGAILLVGLLALNNLITLEKQFQRLLEDHYSNIQATHGIKEGIGRMDAAALFKLMGRQEEGKSMARDHSRIFEKALRMGEEHAVGEEEQKTLRRLRQEWDNYRHLFDKLFTIAQKEEAQAYYFAQLYPAYLAIKGTAGGVAFLNQKEMSDKIQGINAAAGHINSQMVRTTLVVLALGALLSLLAYRRIWGPFALLSKAAHQWREGDLLVRVPIRGEDEIAWVAKEFNKMAQSLDEYRHTSVGELLLAQHTSQATLDALPDPILVTDCNGCLTNRNAAADVCLADLSTGLALATPPEGFFHPLPSWRLAVGGVLNQVLAGHSPPPPSSFADAVTVVLPTGNRIFMIHALPVTMERGQISGAMVILRDITPLRRFGQLQIDLSSTLAHEFRSPLTSLQLAIHLCLEEGSGELTPHQGELLTTAWHDGQRLQTMVNDLLALTQIHSGLVEMKRQPVTVGSLLETACRWHGDVARDKGVDLLLENTPALSKTVSVDLIRLQAVVGNLLGTAIGHTSKGGRITLTAAVVAEMIRFEISDSGEGISPEYPSQLSHKYPLGGLGLAIAQEVISTHGGSIETTSIPGLGNRCQFTLPIKPNFF